MLGGALMAWPAKGRAQQSALPVIGFLSSKEPNDAPLELAAFRQGLQDTGFAEGQSLTIEYRFAGNQNSSLLDLAAELVHRQVSVIVAAGTPAALAAKAATTSIPIVFEGGLDPVRLGLVASLNRPGGNVTGVGQMNEELAAKRLQLLHELVPTANIVALLVDPAYPPYAESDVLAAARSLGLEIRVFNASTERDFDGVFANLRQFRAGGLVISPGTLFTARQELLAALTVRHAVPAVFESREFVVSGGLVSYGGSIADSYRLTGIYAARVLKGEKPGELPVQRGAKVQLFLNLKTAKALGLTVPLPLLGRADEVIE